MRKLISLPGYSLFYFVILFLVASCTNETGGNETPGDTIIDSTKTETEMGQTTTSFISGTLDKLYIEATTFKSLAKSSLVLSFAFRTNDTLTLYGWSCDNNIFGNCKKFNPYPNIKLIKYGSTSIEYGPELTLGNLVLFKEEIKTIKEKLETYKYVVFIPLLNKGNIDYSIYVTNDPPEKSKVLALVPTGIEANPSPPKGYDE